MPTLETAATYAGISLVFGWLRTMIGPHRKKKVQYFISAALSIPVGSVIGIALDSIMTNDGLVFALVAASALIAENILNVVINWGGRLEANPVEAIQEIKQLGK